MLSCFATLLGSLSAGPTTCWSEEQLCFLTPDTRAMVTRLGCLMLSVSYSETACSFLLVSSVFQRLHPVGLMQTRGGGKNKRSVHISAVPTSLPMVHTCVNHVFLSSDLTSEGLFISPRQTLSLRPYPWCSDRCGYIQGTWLMSLS